jgi:hypothetical protein
MVDYRLYFMTSDGHIGDAIDIECEDDAHAIAVVEARGEVAGLELWQRGRWVRNFPAKPIPPPSPPH